MNQGSVADQLVMAPSERQVAGIFRDRFHGCVLGLALGDASGAPYEGGLAERLLWRLIGRTRSGCMRWTDDTRMSLDVIESLLAHGCIDQDDLAARFARSCRWSRGYGPAASRVLKRIARGQDWRQASTSVYADGSFGNGAAMRAPVVGLFYAHRPDEIDDAARRSAVVTHAHPLGIEGAVFVARGTAAAVRGDSSDQILAFAARSCGSDSFVARISIAEDWLASGHLPTAQEIRLRLGNRVAAAESCVTAVYLALRFRDSPFEDLMTVVTGLGGDADTLGAMAGAIWGACNGARALPRFAIGKLEDRDQLERLAGLLFYESASPPPASAGSIVYRASNGEVAWKQADVPTAATEIAAAGLAILGGEVWIALGDGQWEGCVPFRDGSPEGVWTWVTNPRREDETWAAYCQRTATESAGMVESMTVEQEAHTSVVNRLWFNMTWVTEDRASELG